MHSIFVRCLTELMNVEQPRVEYKHIHLGSSTLASRANTVVSFAYLIIVNGTAVSEEQGDGKE